MARPSKVGLDYFPLDVKMEDKVELLEAECGLEGFAILIKLYQKIYGNSFYIPWENDNALLFARKINADLDKVKKVIKISFKRNIFDKDLYDKYKILTSKGIQKRFFEIYKSCRRKGLKVIKDYLLVNVELTGVNVELTQVNDELTQINDESSTQIKQNKIKQNNIKQQHTHTRKKSVVVDTQKIKKVQKMLKDKVTSKQAAKLLDLANNNLDTVQEKVEVMEEYAENNTVKNVHRYMIAAIKHNYQKTGPGKTYTKKKSSNKFYQFQKNPNNYTQDELDKKLGIK